LNLSKLLQTAMHWQNRLSLILFFLDSVKQCYLQTKKACSDVIRACA